MLPAGPALAASRRKCDWDAMRTSGLIRFAKWALLVLLAARRSRFSAALRSAAADSVDAGALDRGRSAGARLDTARSHRGVASAPGGGGRG